MDYIVKFRRPDGTESYLGRHGEGPAGLTNAGRCSKEEAEAYALERNRLYPDTVYWVEEAPGDTR